MSLLDPRFTFKPFEYEFATYYSKLINDSYWTHTKVNFDGDRLGFYRLPEKERNILKRCALCISQIEIPIKKFWVSVGELIPKPEFYILGVTNGEAEARHSLAYSQLLTFLGLEHEFIDFMKNPVIQNRFAWLSKDRPTVSASIAKSIAVFAMLIENVSLFSQFLIMLSYKRKLGEMKNIANMIEWTIYDETAHFMSGAYIYKTLIKEYPSVNTEAFQNDIYEIAEQSIYHEEKIVDYILDGHELPFLKKDTIIEFIKNRVNLSMLDLNLKPVFNNLNQELLKETFWFEEKFKGTSHDDFFSNRPVQYAMNNVSFSQESVF
jgi:ribonucleoside-diphosphate reductase beta chain